ncbi:MAG TPA: HAMP domain-containing protein [Trueperaceae bacterium]|nr:HAMP domain-containing protein [Trueperaceae bacterium]
MDYVVVVVGPVPEDMTVVAGVVSQRFKISEDRAQALLRRAPGPVTKAVPEAQARTVAGILAEAGLNVELREGSFDGPVVPFVTSVPAPAPSSTTQAGPVDPDMEEADTTPTDPGERFDPRAEGLRVHAAPPRDGEDEEDRYREDDERRDDTEPDAVSEEDRAARTTQAPPAGRTTTTPPRDPMKTTLTREPPDLDRRGLRRRIGRAATLPAVLTLLAALLVLTVTLLPALRRQQLDRAQGTAAAVAATIEGLSGGLPLSSPVIRTQLGQVESRVGSQLAGGGLAFLAVVGADGRYLLDWESGSDSLSPETSALVQGAAVRAPVAEVPRDWVGSLQRTWETLLAVVGLREAEPVVASAPIARDGLPLGSVVVGVDSSGLRDELGRVLLSSLLVGLIPVLLAVLAAMSLTRGITDAIRYLLVATDRISHGDFEQPVELQRDDELGQIARAVERMRISLREGMERLRRRR